MPLTPEDRQALDRVGVLLSTVVAFDRSELIANVAAELASLSFYQTGAKDLVRKGSSTGPTRPVSLASYTVYYADRHGMPEAMAALQDWITIGTNDTHAYAYVENVTTEVAIAVASGVTIIPASSAPDEMKSSIAALGGPFNHVGALIGVIWTGSPFLRSKSKDRSEDRLLDDYDAPPWTALIDKALKIIAVATPANPVVRLSGAFNWGEELRMMEGSGGFSTLFPQHAPTPRAKPIPHEKVASLWNAYSELSASDRRRVDVAVGRLALATARTMPGDALVETAISLEAILSDSGNKVELTYRLKLRAALLLGTSLEAPKTIKKLVSDLYEERSAIVHGNVPNENDPALRSRAIKLSQRLIIHVMERGGIPDWQELELLPPPLGEMGDEPVPCG